MFSQSQCSSEFFSSVCANMTLAKDHISNPFRDYYYEWLNVWEGVLSDSFMIPKQMEHEKIEK